MTTLADNIGFICSGLLNTIAIALLTLVLSSIIAAVLGVASIRRFVTLRRIISVYVELFRDTPLIVAMFAIFFGAPGLGVNLSPAASIIAALSLWGGAAGTEIVRAGIDAIAKEQWEAAKVLHLSFAQTLFLIILPQSLPVIAPAFIGLLALLVQGTTLGALVGVPDLLYSGQNIIEQTTVMTGRNVSVTIYLALLLVYFALCYPLTLCGRVLMRRIKSGVG